MKRLVDLTDLDPIFHERVRLGILTLLVQADELDFTTLKEFLGLTDGNLAQHMRVLEEAGIVAVRKTFVGRRPRTYYRLTPAGRRRFREYLDRLRSILEDVAKA
ncbi:MAG: transcriptional regulator [Acidobacteria bacterium]|nr:transcriptional regulator [Acidobacteriota bacterium]MDW7985369.1 transcriptional regulator [Acidobacteriota bacterium]